MEINFVKKNDRRSTKNGMSSVTGDNMGGVTNNNLCGMARAAIM